MRIINRIKTAQPLCQKCEAEGETALVTQVHHIVPIEKGGSDDDENLVGLCDRHHYLEHNPSASRIIGLDGWPVS
jgi:5-methylcytosine-specific restriction enzyme A